MTMQLHSESGEILLGEIQPLITNALISLDELQFEKFDSILEEARMLIKSTSPAFKNDNQLNDIFLINTALDLVFEYADIWKKIIAGEASSSWISLQNALDCIRIIKRNSNLKVDPMEDRLIGLEAAYPYKLFASVGLIASHIECSICGNDVDSRDCTHRTGRLYAGKLAYGTAGGEISLDHVSLVNNPADKRCVIKIDDDQENFEVIRYIARLIKSGEMIISTFARVELTTRREDNPDFKILSRNEMCFCGSGKKFKKCCVNASKIELPHAIVHFGQSNPGFPGERTTAQREE